MANPILQDVMDAINQMQNDITFIKGKVTDIPAIKGNVQTILAKNSLEQECSVCTGTGINVSFEDSQPGVPINKPCSACNGTGKRLMGTLVE